MTTDSADYCIPLMSGYGQSHESAYNAGSGHRFSFGVRAWTQMEIWHVNCMCMLKATASEQNFGFKVFNKLINNI